MKMLITAMLALALAGDAIPRVEPPAVPQSAEAGFAPHYSPKLMLKVSKRRKLEPAPCMVSRPLGPIGGWVFVHGERTGTTLLCKVVDVSHPRHLKGHLKRRIITELSYEVTKAICGTTKGSTRECPVRVWDAG